METVSILKSKVLKGPMALNEAPRKGANNPISLQQTASPACSRSVMVERATRISLPAWLMDICPYLTIYV
jgi:hypothetical protein